VLLAACSSDLPHEAPFDASAPLSKQAKSSLSGTVVLEGETDHSQITLDLQNPSRTYNVDTAADGKLSLTGIVPGTYSLSLRTRYFEGVTETIVIGLGDTVNLGTRTLAPRMSRVLGQAVSERLVGAEIAKLGGVNLSLKKTGSIRSATAGAPGYQPAAAPPPAGYTLRTLSGSAGDFEFTAVPAGVYALAAATPETGERSVGKVTVTGEGDVKVEEIVLRPLTGYFEIQGLANGVPSSTFTSVANVNLQLQQSNAVKVKVAVSTDGTTAGCNLAAAPKEALPTNTLRPLTFTSEGKKLVCVSYVDADGKETAPIYGTITYDATPPAMPSVVVNGGAAVVSSNLVTLSLSAVDASGVTTYKIGSATGVTAESAKPFQTTDVGTFAAGEGQQVLWVMFGDQAGNYSAPIRVTVTLDTVAPTFSAAPVVTRLDGTPLTTGATLAESRIKLVSSYSDATGLEMQVSTTGIYAGQAWVPYDAAKFIDLPSGPSSLSVRVRDAAGHVVDVVTAFDLTTDTTPPTGTLNILAAAVTDPVVQVQATGSGDAVAVELAFDPGFVTSLGTFTPGPLAVTLAAGDGTKTLYGRFFDAAGNASALVGDTVVLDTTPPQVLSLAIAQASPTKDNPVDVLYGVSGAAELRIVEGAACGGAREAVGAGTKTFTLSAAEGSKDIRVQFFDAAGNASACLLRSIYFDPNPPVVGSLQLNFGQAATSSNVISVSFVGISGATKVMISEDAAFAGVLWDGFAATKTFTLSPGNGVKTVSAKVADEAGHVVNVPQATITLDTTPPAAPAIFAAVDVTTQTSVLLTLSAGLVSEMWLVQDDPSFSSGAWEPYTGSKVFSLSGADGTKTLYAKFKKSTGLETGIVSDTVILDRAAPTLPSVQINGGAAVATSNIVTLNLSAVDAASGLATYRVNTVNDFSAVSPKPYQQSDVFSFGAGDGLKTVWITIGDRAGQYSAPVSATVLLDTTAPAVGGPVSLTKLDGTSLTTGDTLNESRVMLTSAVSDASNLQMQITTNGSYTGVAWVPYEANKTIDLAGGASSISVRVRDGAGLVTDLITAFTLTLDTTPPTGTLVIAPTAVTDTAITVQATGSADALEVELAFDPGFVTSLGRFTPGPIPVTLQPGDGVKTVYARFFDAAGNTSALTGDTVVLDTTPPQILSYTIAQASPTKDNPITVQYSVAGVAELRITEGAVCDGIREPIGTGSRSYAVSASEGLKEIRVQFFDAAGNASECAVRAVTYDPNPPVVGSMQLNYGQAATSANVVTVSFAGVSGATKVILSEDAGFAGADWSSYAATKTFVLSAGNGVKTVYAKVADDAGHVVTVPSATITLDTSSPTVPSIFAAVDVTTQTSVLLTLAAGVMQDMMLSQDDPAFATATWEPYAGSKVFALTGADGIKTIYAKFRKANLTETAVVSDTVILDRAAPTLPSVRVDGNAAVVASASLVLNLSAVDAASGLATYKINTVNDFSAVSAEPFQSNVLYGLVGPDGPKTIWVTIGDKAGMYSAPVSTTVLLDTAAPVVNSAVVQSAGGAPLATGSTIAGTSVVLASAVTDLSPALMMQVSTTGSFAGAAWVPYTANATIPLPSGASSLAVRVRDEAGHITDLISGFALTVDTTPPTSPSLTINGKIGGAVSTTTVSVTLSVSGDAVDAELAYDPGFVTSLGFFAPNATHNVALLAGDGSKSLYVRFFDAAGNESVLAGDTVVLDTTPPIASFTIAEVSPTKTNPLTLNYTQAGATQLRVAEDTVCAGALEAVGSGTRAFAGSSSEGLKDVRMQFFDAVGNASACLVQTVYFDPNPPVVGTLQINYGQAATSSNVVTLSFPGVSGATKIMVSEDAGFAGADWQAFAATKTFTLSAGNGVKTVYAKVADDAGHVVNLTQQSITLDTTPPTSPSIFAAYDVTSQTSVTLFLSAGLVSEMWITQDDPAFTTRAWEAYSGTQLFALTGTDGTKTLYAKFKKSTGVETSVVSDTVVLDRTAPILPSLQVNGGAAVVTSNVVTLNLSAVDSASGLYTYKVNDTNDFTVLSPKPYQTSDVYALAGGDGAKTVWVTFADRAGNYSSPASVTVFLDQTAPAVVSAALQLSDASAIANGQTIRESRVYLATSVSDLTPLEMQITTNGSFTGIAWEPYAATKVIDLALPAGQTPELRNVQARVRDGAGHVVNLINLDMLLDTRAPTGTLTLTSPVLTNDNVVSVSLSANEAPSEAQLSTDPSFGGASWFATVNTSFTVPAGDGIRTVYARFRDGAGNLSGSVTVSLTLDMTPPALPSVLIDGGAAATNLLSGAVALQLSGVDAGSGVVKMRLANLVSGACAGALSPVAEENYATAKSWMINDPGADKVGTRWVCAALRDGAGNWSVPVSDSIAYDTEPPAVYGGGVLINGGDVFLTSTFAELALMATGATEMMLVNGVSFGGGTWEAYRTTTSWYLPPSAVEVDRVVSVKFRDAAGNETAGYGDGITLDTGVPGSPTLEINGGSPYAVTTSVGLTLFATGADTVRLSNDPLFMPHLELPFATSVTGWVLAAGDGQKTVYAQYFDRAGNASAVVSEHVLLDTVAPANADFVIDDAPVTPLTSVYLTLTADDAVQMQVSEGGCVGSWVTYAPNASYSFASSLDGEKYISVRFRDVAGNMSPCLTRSITLDGTAPYITTYAPRTGKQGASFVISGVNFGATSGTVTIGGVPLSINAWSNSEVTVTIPANVDPGTQDVILTTSGGKSAKTVTFFVTIFVSALTPVRVAQGQNIMITGTGFGTSGTLYFGGVSVPTTTWTRTSIVVPGPQLIPGTYTLTLASRDATWGSEEIILRPMVTTVSPATGAVDAAITLTGYGFGGSQGNSQVTLGSLPVTVTSWANTSISGIVPTGLLPGRQKVEVVVNTASSLPVTYTVTPDARPVILSVLPLAQTVGRTVTVLGGDFGAAQGTVSMDGLAATVAAWYPTAITFTVPVGSTGEALIRVQRADLVSTDTAWAWIRTTNSWDPGVPLIDARYGTSAAWTGTEMLVLGGTIDGVSYNYDGARYNPALDSWTRMARSPLPGSNVDYPTVWMGKELFQFGGASSYRYNPATNAWTGTGTGEPAWASGRALVWTGSRIIVWGGQFVNTGGIYNPVANTWTATSTVGAPTGRYGMAAVWTGDELLIWGGRSSGGSQADGARYDPVGNTWSALPASPVPARYNFNFAWTGGELIVHGGGDGTGGRFNPKNNQWKVIPTYTVAYDRGQNRGVWTGKEFVVWGGGQSALGSGGRYNPGSNVWTAMGGSAPVGRGMHSTVWTGTEMIVWGGFNSGGTVLNTGGRYNPATNAWVATAVPAQAPAFTISSGAKIWSGTEMLQWNGTTGERFDPVANRVVAMGTSGAPANSGGAGTWSGTRAYFWGTSAGGAYNPATNAWTAMSTTNQPSSPGGHFMYWNAVTSNVIVLVPSSFTGGLYFPLTNTWQTMTTAGAPPLGRSYYSTVWTGTYIIVFGGRSGSTTEYQDGFKWAQSATGGTWSKIADASSPRFEHAAVWTGTKMYVIGGWYSNGFCGSASTEAYDPATNSWTSEPTGFGRMRPAVAWNGTYIFQWGGSFDGTTCGTGYLGGRVYNPATGISTAMSTVGAGLPGGTGLTALGAGDEFFMWNGTNMFRYMPPP
jgi:hypothetical protein